MNLNNKILVSAAPFELGDLHTKLPKQNYFCLGVGVLNTSINCVRNQNYFVGKEIIFLGSAGIFGNFDVPNLYLINRVHWSPMCQRLGDSYPVPEYPSIDFAPTLREAMLPKAEVLCSTNVSTKSHAHSLKTNNIVLENIELYFCAAFLRPVCKNFNAILASTNSVGSSSHEQWKSNHKRAAELVSDYLSNTLL